MHISFFDKIANSISWSLIHSLWQGLILTVLAGLVMFMTKKSSSSYRYSLLSVLFFLFLGGIVGTFFLEWSSGTGESSGLKLALNSSADEDIAFHPSVFHELVNKFSYILHSNSPWILLIWVIILGVKSVRMVLGFTYINRLRKQQVFATDDNWKIRLKALCDQMGIRQKVALMESALVRIPIVIGHLKPVILVPIGILTNLRPGEVEAVLLHELAHIRRHDYLVNLIQRITEMLLFFNPGLLWVSSLMRIERENCCDDIAIARIKDKRQFVEALISFKEHSLKSPEWAMSLLGKRNLLVQRMSRIVYNRNKTLSPFETVFFVSSFVIFILLATAFIKPKQVAQASPLPLYSLVEPINFIPFKPAVISTSSVTNEAVHIGKEIRPLLTSNKSAIKTNTEIKEPALREDNGNTDTEEFGKIRQDAERDRKQAELERLQAEKDRIAADRDRYQAWLDRKQADKDRAQADIDRQIAEKDRAQADKDRIQAEKDRRKADQDRQEIETSKYQLTHL